MRGTRARWAVALRIARRGALKSWGRSLLIVILIAAPIVGLAGAAVLLLSSQSTLSERIQGNLGSAQARLTVVGGPKDGVRQGVEGGYDYTTSNQQETSDATRIDPRTVLPAGTRVLRIGNASATFALGAGAVSLSAQTGPSWDRSLDGGPYALLSGTRPAATDQVLLSPAALQRLGARVGGTVRMTAPEARVLRVVGTARDRSQPSDAQTVFAPAALLQDATATADAYTYFVPSAVIDWSTTQRLNAAGTTAFSRAVVLDPPSDAPDSGGGGLQGATLVVVVLAIVFAVLEVALLAGSAFLVGARLQQRMLATIASIGAERSVLRRIVTANGVVLGAAGGVIGVGLGILGAVVVMRLTDDGSWTRYPGLHLQWALLGGIAAFGVLVGWIAALMPARAASRFDVIRALRGARTPQRTGRKPVLGVVLLAAGIVMTLLGGGALFAVLRLSGDTLLPTLGAVALLGGGPVVAQLGVLLCAGLVLRGVARLIGGISLPARLAARDTARNLGRAVPAVASVMTTVFIAAFVMCVANTSSLQSAAQYYWQAPEVGRGVVGIASGSDAGSGRPTVADAVEWTRVLRADLPVAASAVTGQSRQSTDDPTPSNRTRDALPNVRVPDVPVGCTEAERRDASDLRCGRFTAGGGHGPSAQTSVTVGDAQALGLLLGHAPSSAAVSALDEGDAVALRSDLAPGGRATIDWFTPKQLATDWTSGTPRRSTHLAAVVDLPVNPVQDSLFVTPSTASRLGLSPAPAQVLLSFTRPPTQSELDTADSALGALVNQPGGGYVSVEQGPQDYGSQIAWWILLGCLIIAISAGATAIGLARVDGRADDLTLASLGAAPGIRRSVAFVQALIVCGLGALIGTALGLLPAVALGAATSSLPFAPPGLQLVLVAIGIPIVIAVGSWALVGRRGGDLTRRAAIA